MSNSGDSERKTQNRVSEFFQIKLHYRYIGNLKDQANCNTDEEKLIKTGVMSELLTRRIRLV